MKEILLQYARYNKWANDRLIDAILNLPNDVIDAHVESSFSSLRATCLHVWNADFIWWERLKLAENIVGPATDATLSIEAICEGWKQQSLQWQNWVMNAKEVNLTHVFAYRNSKKEQFKEPVYQVLMHVFNHATYHRGQMVTMMRQLDVKTIPATDFIVFSRNKK